MIAVMYLSAIIIGINFPGWVDDTPEVDLGWGCNDDYDNSCLLDQLVYRATAALLIVFGVIMLGTYAYAPMHTGLWAIKYTMLYLIWFLFLFCKNHGFDKLVSPSHCAGCSALRRAVLFCDVLCCAAPRCPDPRLARRYGNRVHARANSTTAPHCAPLPRANISRSHPPKANITRFMSFFWLCTQSLLVIELSFQLNDYIAANNSGGILVLASGLFAAAGIWGCTVLYDDYAGCTEGWYFVNTTVVMSVLAVGLSVVDAVGVGLLPGTVVFAYSVFMCWYALLSSTDTECNPSADESELDSTQKSRAFWIIMGVTAVCMGFMMYTGSKIVTILTGEEVTSVAGVVAQKEAAAAAAQPGLDEILTTDVSDKTPLKEQPKAEPDADAADDATSDTAAGQTDSNSACCFAGLAASKPSEMNLGEPKEETVFFHFLMLILIMYCTMALVSDCASTLESELERGRGRNVACRSNGVVHAWEMVDGRFILPLSPTPAPRNACADAYTSATSAALRHNLQLT